MSAAGARTYRHFLDALGAVAYKGAAPPKLHNYHQLIQSPFHKHPIASSDPFLAPLKARSEAYSASIAASSASAASQPATVTNIPVPTVLVRHLLQPVPVLEQGTSLGKVVGFRIVTKGRRGTRTNKQVVDFGRMDTGATAALTGVYVDFGKSHFVNKKGSTGVKVWVTYGSN
eukprot:jgi/Hompol1/6099/HPOL_000359-RA